MKQKFSQLLFGLASPVLLLIAGCSGGSSNNENNTVAANVVTLSVESPLVNTGYNDNGNAVNVPYVTVTICKPGTDNCVTVDHILLDTGSTGLRVVSSVLESLGLSTYSQGGNQINECTTFGTGYTWGPIAYADVKIGGETASNIPFNLIGGTNIAVPSGCSDAATPPYESSVASFGSNGIIGVNPQVVDNAFLTQPSPAPTSGGGYYSCSQDGNCSYIILPDNLQVVNPVAHFPIDNNGEILKLPSVNESNPASLTGTLTFGINTEANNQLPTNANLFFSDPTNLDTDVGTIYDGVLVQGLFDSGTQGYLVPNYDSYLCSTTDLALQGLLCPPNPLSLGAFITSSDGSNPVNYNYTITNAIQWITQNPTASVYPNLGYSANFNGMVIWGLPFFIGKNIYLGFVGATVNGVESTPFAAYTSYNPS